MIYKHPPELKERKKTFTDEEYQAIQKYGEDIIEIIKECRKAIDGQSYSKALQTLNFFGFNSINEYVEWEHNNYINVIKACVRLRGECDLCGNLPYEKRACVITLKNTFKDALCVKPEQKVSINDAYSEVLHAYLARYSNKGKFKYENPNANRFKISNKIYATCPPGHGFYALQNEIKQIPIDFNWTPPTYWKDP